ncbi:MAG: hypothetical protein Q8M92_09420 [Candidatus Subteraquimicrobiales bacterium]|nr:hypothetical protein [Candidatus Subteraquimicrobiales bacterium]
MCLRVTRENATGKYIKKDTTVYVGRDVGPTGMITSPYTSHHWQLGEMQVDINKMEWGVYMDTDRAISRGAFHSFPTLEDAKKYFKRELEANHYFSIFSATIPVRSEYWEGTTYSGADKTYFPSIASKKLRLDERVT